MKKQINFYIVNSFADKAFEGNPAGVVLDAAGIDTQTMQAIAKQLNLVETIFISDSSPEDIDFALRYFTPEKELPIAGHPTIAGVAVLLEQGRIDDSAGKIVVNTQAGNVDVFTENNKIYMQQIAPVFIDVTEGKKEIANIFGIKESDIDQKLPIKIVNIGLGHLIVCVNDLSTLMKVKRNIDLLKPFVKKYNICEAQIFCFQTYAEDTDLHTRNICPREGLEDPACGNGNAALGAYLIKYYSQKAKEMFTIEQGYTNNMRSNIEVMAENNKAGVDIMIGGAAVIMAKGSLFI